MSSPCTRLVAIAAVLASSTAAGASGATPKSAPKPDTSRWCAPELEALSDTTCRIGASPSDGPRTLVIFLHGAIAENVTWQWTQQRALARQAKSGRFEAIFPRAPLGPHGYTWPGGGNASKAETVAALEASWLEAKATLEEKNGRPFDEIFVMGFSSGAYFTSDLALQGRPYADGFAVFAGGAGHAQGEPTRRSPVFVGVCADDRQTAAHSRAFGQRLAARGFVRRVDEQRVGHMFGDVHVAHAISWLRSMRARPH